MKKQIILGIGILLVLNLIICASSLSYNEDENGNPFYESELKIKTPQITIKNFLLLSPSTEPVLPVFGMIYLDSVSKKLRFYDGETWKVLKFEEEKGALCSVQKTCGEWSSCSNDKQTRVCTVINEDCSRTNLTQEDNCMNVEKAKKDSAASGQAHQDLATCTVSRQCGAWGDCINNLQTRDCFGVNEGCSEFKEIEEQSCSAENPFQEEIEEAKEEIESPVIVPEEVPPAEEPTTPTETPAEIPSEAPPEESPAPEEAIPEQLFDITFDIEDNSLSVADRLAVWITLQNFGKRYVPARLDYSVYDSDGNKKYEETEEIRVYTDQSIIKQFSNLKLDDGEYTLKLNVEYAGIVEQFEGKFKIKTGWLYILKSWFNSLLGE
ncbi:MAG: hypothetical protein PHQ66_01660 [Candidatus Nanoarchaeia archaeon]|nr:hypothetical protein [Candidatus Nanoarchaeia archaeon]MDD5357918.1 hypothetical protein [Candidatus Nanoarchaeia archaeon]MDD5588837.1 hypothetical protein [Candidatus Nanoarchaeia archaeon]